MTVQELGTALSAMYNNAPEGKKATSIHLFGIKYAKIIQQEGHTAKSIIQSAKLGNGEKDYLSYATEITKGVNLAAYVIEKSRIQALLDE